MPAARPVRLPSARLWPWIAAPLLLAPLLLSDCAPKANTFAPYCPTPRRLSDASQIAIYRPGSTSHEIIDNVLQGQIVDVYGSCQNGDDKNTVQADASVAFRFVRGPAMQGRTIDVPYLITITMGEDIREQARLLLRVTFPSNVDTVTLTSEPLHMVFPVTKTTNAASYTIWAAFRLTPEQLEYNRQHGQ
jgi:hypothetical protein